MTGATASVEVVAAIADPSGDTFFVLSADSQNQYAFNVIGGMLMARERKSGQITTLQVSDYDPVAHRFWRFEHDIGDATLRYRTSANGQDWATRYSTATGGTLGERVLDLGAGAFGSGLAGAGEARFDNLELCRP